MNISCDCQSSRPSPKKLCCPKGVEIDYVELPASLGTSAPGQPNAPENGAYKNAVVKYVADGHVYIYTSEGIPVLLSDGSGGGSGDVISVNGKTGEVVLTTSDLENDSDYQSGTQVLNAINTAIGELSIPSKTSQLVNDGATGTSTYVEATALADEISARENADDGLQGQIDALAASSDVTDIVGTYADLQAYDTTKLKDNDIIKVLQDEQHDNETTYYRWSTTTETFTLIGEEGPYYTKSAADQKFQDKLTAGTNISIDPLTETISASFDAETIFYANLNETGTSRHIYKDIAFTTAASAQDLIDANDIGQVILRGTSTANPTAYSDSYLQNAFIMPHNNDFEFVFLDRDLRYEYTAGATTDTVFYYSTSEIQPKLTAGTNVTITGTTISATDTTYSDFTGTDGQTAGTAGLVPAPATTDAGKFLKADGTWDTAGGGSSVNVVQTTGTSTADVMSQDATTKMIWPNVASKPGIFIIGSGIVPTISSSTNYAVGIGSDTFYQRGAGNNAVSIGRRATAGGAEDIAIGEYADAGASGGYNNVAIGDLSIAGSQAKYCVALGSGASTNASGNNQYSVALGAKAKISRNGEVNIGTGTTTNGYNSTSYRVLGGVHAAVDNHDAVNLEQMNARILAGGTAAPTTSTVGEVGALYAYVENGTGHLAICTAVSGTTYTWQTLI